MSVKLTTPLAKTWKRRLDRWRQSGLSAAVFSKQEKVSQPRLYTWRKRFADSGRPPLPKDPAPTFVPVRVQPALASIEVALKGGHLLRLPADVSPARLAEILKAVAPC